MSREICCWRKLGNASPSVMSIVFLIYTTITLDSFLILTFLFSFCRLYQRISAFFIFQNWFYYETNVHPSIWFGGDKHLPLASYGVITGCPYPILNKLVIFWSNKERQTHFANKPNTDCALEISNVHSRVPVAWSFDYQSPLASDNFQTESHDTG